MKRPGDKGPTGGEVRLVAAPDAQGPPQVVSRSIEQITSPRLREVFEVWRQKCAAADRLPPAEEFDIFDYRAAVGNINLIEVRPEPLDFIFRVHCVTGASYVGRDLTGCSVDDYPDPEYRAYVRSVFTRATAERQPQIIIESLETADHRRMRWEGIVMPLQNRAGAVTRLIVTFEIVN